MPVTLKRILFLFSIGMLAACGGVEPQASSSSALEPQGRLDFRGADPSVIRVGSTYYAVDAYGEEIFVRSARSVDGLGNAPRHVIYREPLGNVWAPELVRDPLTGRFYIFYAPGPQREKRMYVVESVSPGHGYGNRQRMALPDNKWAIDGVSFVYSGQRWFTWSGWVGDENGEQTLFIARMDGATTTTGPRFVVSQPREPWERADYPHINEGPQPIIDPNGQLHIIYSANGSWNENYCLADLRLRAGGDPTYVWDWYKSNGCLFGYNGGLMMPGWDSTLYAKGVGHHSFVLLNGDPNTSPPAGPSFPLVYHGVPKGDNPNPFWDGRYWYSGSFAWWGNTTYTRGSASNTGWSLKFFE